MDGLFRSGQGIGPRLNEHEPARWGGASLDQDRVSVDVLHGRDRTAGQHVLDLSRGQGVPRRLIGPGDPTASADHG